jgi:hypothetical protein
MRDDFLMLVNALNAGGDYRHASEAQSMVIALTKFEDDHNVTDVAWPPVADPEGGLLWVGDDSADDTAVEHGQESNAEFMAVVLKSYLGDCTDGDPRLAAAWWGWRAARGEIQAQLEG